MLRVLLVEDNAFDAQAVRMGLGKCAEETFDLVHVDRLALALEQIASGVQFDLILLDLGLPDAQGMQALRRVHEAAPNVAIVILSGLDRGETIFQAIEMGAQDYLVKSEIDARMLRRAVHYAIERKCAELKLRADQERLRFAIETAKDAIILAEPQGRILSWNRAAQELFGWSREEALALSIAALFPERQRAQQSDALSRLLAAPGSQTLGETLQSTGLRNDGTEFPIEVSASRSEINGRMVLCGIFRDLTERQRAEASLIEGEQRFRTLAELAPVGIFHTDAAGHCLIVNPRWCELTGLPAAQATGEVWTTAVHPADRERVRSAWEEAMRVTGRFALEFRFQPPTGEVVWVLAQARLLKTITGQVLGYIGTVTDITGRKVAELERERLLQELQTSTSDTRQLSGLICICAQCKKIRDQENHWTRFETYFRKHTDTTFTHGLCPHCTDEFLKGVKPTAAPMF